MPVEGRRQPEQRLQKDVQIGRCLEIRAAHDMRDALQGVVVNDGEVIGGRDVGPHDERIAPARRGFASTCAALAGVFVAS